MKQKNILHLTLIFVFILFSLVTEAAIRTTQLDTLLVIQRKEQVEFSLKKKRRIFKKNDKVIYQTYDTSKSITGEIYGFEDNTLIIKDNKGKFNRVEISELKSIGKPNDFITILSIFSIIIVLCLILMVLLVILAVVLFIVYLRNNPPNTGAPPPGGSLGRFLVLMVLLPIFGLPGFLGLRRNYKYKFTKNWKADIVKIEAKTKKK